MTAEIRSCFESYREDGNEEADFRERSFIEQGGDSAIADLCLKIRRHAGNGPWRPCTDGNQCRGDGEWTILNVTAYREERFCKEEHAS
jgi:hypothetical protein